MLVLSRRTGEEFQIGNDVVLSILRVEGKKVRIGISAPPHVRVERLDRTESPSHVRLEPTDHQRPLQTDAALAS